MAVPWGLRWHLQGIFHTLLLHNLWICLPEAGNCLGSAKRDCNWHVFVWFLGMEAFSGLQCVIITLHIRGVSDKEHTVK